MSNTLLFQRQYVIAVQKRNGYQKQKHQKVKNTAFGQ